MKSAVTIGFDYRPSIALTGAGACVVLLATAAVLASGMPLPLRAVLAPVVLLAGTRALWRFLRSPVRHVAHGLAGWTLVGGRGSAEAVTLRGHARIGALHALDFLQDSGKRARIVLTPDNLDADRRRRLRLILSRGDILHRQ
ncbi:MAG TPA: hypothetical protein VFG55_06190 [Rhodanobacteraceae bacterium]|nr:hypothetical protein [Rhodanobacteraceae bacterium]